MRLVIQSPTLSDDQVHIIADMFPASNIVRINSNAAYIKVETRLPAVQNHCDSHQIDFAFVEDAHLLGNFGLAVMDMDSTLISIECIDEIADMCGLKDQVSKVTESAMRGEIDFAQSLRQRVALLAGLPESALHEVIDQRLRLNPGAQLWLDTCKQHGITTLLVSGGFTFFAEKVKAMTGLDHARANTLEIIDGKLTGKVLGHIVDGQAKADYLNELRTNLGLEKNQVIAIGDGANDLKMMSEAAVGIAYHAKPIVQQQATYSLNHMGLDGIINLFTVI